MSLKPLDSRLSRSTRPQAPYRRRHSQHCMPSKYSANASASAARPAHGAMGLARKAWSASTAGSAAAPAHSPSLPMPLPALHAIRLLSLCILAYIWSINSIRMAHAARHTCIRQALPRAYPGQPHFPLPSTPGQLQHAAKVINTSCAGPEQDRRPQSPLTDGPHSPASCMHSWTRHMVHQRWYVQRCSCSSTATSSGAAAPARSEQLPLLAAQRSTAASIHLQPQALQLHTCNMSCTADGSRQLHQALLDQVV